MSQAQANDIESARRAAASLVGMKNPTMREAAESLFQFSRNPNVFPTTPPPPAAPMPNFPPQLPNADLNRNPVPIRRAEPSPDFSTTPEGVVPSGEVTATSTATGGNVPNLPSLD
tara:strand:- start:216 stop:560 length:345 start_codon:yes stop_codon:yes gene_type:complete